MERITRFQHQDKEIVRIDFTGLVEDDELIEFIKEIEDYVIAINYPTLQLNIITGVYFTPNVMNKLTEAGKRWNHFVIRDAIVGVVGVKKILLQVYNTIVGGKAKAFDTEEDALAWLVS